MVLPLVTFDTEYSECFHLVLSFILWTYFWNLTLCLCVCVCVWVCVLIAQSYLSLCDPMDCNSPGSSVHGILQGRILEWVAKPFSRVSSQPRDRTHVFCIIGRFFTVWATREAQCWNSCLQEYWSGLPSPSPQELPNPGIEPWSPASQADPLPFELSVQGCREIGHPCGLLVWVKMVQSSLGEQFVII